MNGFARGRFFKTVFAPQDSWPRNEDLARTPASITFLMFVCRPVEIQKCTDTSLSYSATSLSVHAPFRLLKGRHTLTLFINKYFLQIE